MNAKRRSIEVLEIALRQEEVQLAAYGRTIIALQTQITNTERLAKESRSRIAELRDAMAKLKSSAPPEAKKEKEEPKK